MVNRNKSRKSKNVNDKNDALPTGQVSVPSTVQCSTPSPDSTKNKGTKQKAIKDTKKNIETRTSRTLFLTLTGSPNNPIDGTIDEYDYIIKYFTERYSTVDYIVISLEQHESGENHIHAIVRLTRPSFTTDLNDTRKFFDNWKGSKTNQIKLGNNVTKIIGYICKTTQLYPDWKPYVYGNISVDKCLDLGRTYKYDLDLNQILVDKHKLSCDAFTVQSSKSSMKLISALGPYMKENNWYVNVQTNGLYHPIYSQNPFADIWLKFCHEVNQWTNPLSIQFGLYVTDNVKKIISDPGKHSYLPTWDPILTKFQFKDGTFDIRTNIISYNENDINCVNIIDCTLEEMKESPKYYIERLFDIFCVKSEVERFRKVMRTAFLPKVHREKSLMLCGPTLTGKSLIIDPFIRSFRHVLGDWSDDGGFTVASIAQYPKVIANEVNPMNYKDYGDKVLKEMLEGIECNTKIKHKQEKALVIIKNILFTANAYIKKIEEYDSLHAQAIRGRLEVFNVIKGVDHLADHRTPMYERTMLGRIIYWLSLPSFDYSEYTEHELPEIDYSKPKIEFDPINHPNKYINIPQFKTSPVRDYD